MFTYGYKTSNLDICIGYTQRKHLENFEKRINSLDYIKKFDEKKFTVLFGNGKSHAKDKKLTYLVSSPLWFGKKAKIGVGSRSTVIQDLKIGHNEIIYSIPEGFTDRFREEVVIDVMSDIWKSYPEKKLVAEKVRSNSYFSEYGLSTFCGANKNTNTLWFNVLDDWNKIKLFFEAIEHEIKPSKITSYSNSVINLLGGIKNLKIFNNKLIIELLNILSIKSSQKLAQKIISKTGRKETNEDELIGIFDEFNLAPELKSIPKTYKQLKSLQQIALYKREVLSSLNELSKKQIIKRGFYIECNTCGIKEWHSLAGADEYLTCPGCNSKFILPVEEFKGIETEWRYRLNSLINRAVDQDIIAALVAVSHLTQKRTTHCHYFGIELFKSGKNKPETDIDFCFVENQKLIAGECKTNDSFSEKDFRNALLLAQIGIDKFYFCTLADFSEQSRKMVEDFKNSLIKKKLQMKVQTISSADLFK